MTSVAALVAALRARGVTLEPRGDKLRVRPVSRLTPNELEALRQYKAEVLALLTPVSVTLDIQTVREVLGREATDPHAVACVRFAVVAALRELEAGIRAGSLPPRRLVHGRPLADWLDLNSIARLLRAGGARR
jgi:hypothetical protein